jgi:serine phosphatase RsbU (regulator of sigma subunit)
VEQQLLRVDNSRKTEELEAARQLQLSLLPHSRPTVPGWEVGFGMRTAQEVGGDYYDYHQAPGGGLTLALGDATGHGLQAGMMVMATKSLFQASGDDDGVLDTLARVARGIESLGVRRMHMALTLMQLEGDRLAYAAAGTPPLLIYRAERGEVEELGLSAPPLGSLRTHRYRMIETHLGPGDALLAATDGLAEMLDPDDEMFGYDTLLSRFAELARSAPDEVLEGLFDAAAQWARGRVQEDDQTLIFVRRQV